MNDIFLIRLNIRQLFRAYGTKYSGWNINTTIMSSLWDVLKTNTQ